jgi:hypothetical protein
MKVVLSSDVRHALELILKASVRERISVAHILLRGLATSSDIGVTGKGFLQEAGQYLQAILDWIAVGTNNTADKIKDVAEDSNGA